VIHLLPCSFILLQLVTDVNLAVAVEATQAIGNLAKGLRTHFSGNSRNLLPTLLVSPNIIFSE
jgi:cytoskeleton-associated protein 5